MVMVFTCTKCDTRSVKSFSKQSYQSGVVLVRCPGCSNLHLIADHLGWFGEQPFLLHEHAAQLGRNVVRISSGAMSGGEHAAPQEAASGSRATGAGGAALFALPYAHASSSTADRTAAAASGGAAAESTGAEPAGARPGEGAEARGEEDPGFAARLQAAVAAASASEAGVFELGTVGEVQSALRSAGDQRKGPGE